MLQAAPTCKAGITTAHNPYNKKRKGPLFYILLGKQYKNETLNTEP